MRRILLAFGLAACVAGAGGAQAQIVINAPPADAAHPWQTCAPGSRSTTILDYVPARAKRAGVTGTIDIQCKVSATARTQACTWIKETPKGYGFGPAAAKYGCLLRVQPRFLKGVGPGGVRVNTTLHMRPTRAF
jgi:hypothetical protein